MRKRSDVEQFTKEEIESYAKRIAMIYSIPKRINIFNWPLKRMNDNYSYIKTVYKELNEDIHRKDEVPFAAEWIMDNFFIIEEQVVELRRELLKSNYYKMPVHKSGNMKGYTRIYAIAVELIGYTDGRIDEKIFSDYLNAYQSHIILNDKEIWFIPLVMRLALLDKIKQLCENIKNTQKQRRKAESVYNEWLLLDQSDEEKSIKFINDSLKPLDEINFTFIEHLFYLLRNSGRSYAKVLEAINRNLEKLDTSVEEMTGKEHSMQSINTVSMGNCITSLRFISLMDWTDLFESASQVNQILKQDPQGTYSRMDLESRSYYRHKVEQLAKEYDVSEVYIAKEAVNLAKEAYDACLKENETIDKDLCKIHVGYYLVGDGLERLLERQDTANKFSSRFKFLICKGHGAIYMCFIGLITAIIMGLFGWYAVSQSSENTVFILLLTLVTVFIPVSEVAVKIVNWITCLIVKPDFFPRLELEDGIPKKMSTIVTVPSLIPDVEHAKELLVKLESHYLSNKEENLYFVLLGAFADSEDGTTENDEKIIRTTMQGIAKLNKKYENFGQDKFYFFHRKSQFNDKNNKWFAWERKRGALVEFNEFVLGSKDTSFSYLSDKEPNFSDVKYIITLDSDTILPIGMAKKMIGTMAHPLNHPVVDKEKGLVVKGYGLMQPKIEVENESANKTAFSKIFTGQEGVDPYANAISNVYQDLFSEGIFTGKGIYDVEVFQSVLKSAIPDDTILSHDLLEGSYVRAGLVTTLKLIDSVPSTYESYSARRHRWVRGDWQLTPLLFSKIYNRHHEKIDNPLSLISKWKIFDNLRSSLIAPSLMLLLILGVSILPGDFSVWLCLFLGTQLISLLIHFSETFFSWDLWSTDNKRHITIMGGSKSTILQALLSIMFLPYHAAQMIHAVSITLVRVFITKKNLLEWVTSDMIEKQQKKSLSSYIIKMSATFVEVALIWMLTFIFNPNLLLLASFLAIYWAVSPFIAFWISLTIKEKKAAISEEVNNDLSRLARKTWRFFEEFINPEGNYLAPDNYQLDPPNGIAYRTSPTNIGLSLLSVLTARDFGYIGTNTMIETIDHIIHTMEKLEKWNGHLLNWYNTKTLRPLQPIYISTVDSGNLVSYLITLEQGLLEYLKRPLVEDVFIEGLRDSYHCGGEEALENYRKLINAYKTSDDKTISIDAWNRLLNHLEQSDSTKNINEEVWKDKIDAMIINMKWELSEWMPGAQLMNNAPAELVGDSASSAVKENMNVLRKLLLTNGTLEKMPLLVKQQKEAANQLKETIGHRYQDDNTASLDWILKVEERLEYAQESLDNFLKKYHELIDRINALHTVVDFLPLYDKSKDLFSIGYSLKENKLTDSYYDLLASEARQASYVSVARGTVPSSHWYKMGRALTVVGRKKGLISWTGTMFEYLMPLLLMKNYKSTLLDETYSFVVQIQKKYGQEKEIPWGTSESGFYSLDKKQDYQYKAIGVPWLGLKRGLVEDAVVAPYATFLALMVDPESAIMNIEALKKEGLEGPFGFYEAADYTPERLVFESKRVIVKSFMAHHQGMCLLSLNNYLKDNILQERFMADITMHTARILLQEKISANFIFTKELKNKIEPFEGIAITDKKVEREFNQIDEVLPKAHILSNGFYSVLITDRGTGYSKTKTAAVSRWREDSTLDPFGTFFYLRNLSTSETWSAAYAPYNKVADDYEVIFTPDKAVFSRKDGQIETKTEIIVASGDNVEIRRISLTNNGESSNVIEITSYYELVLGKLDSDIAHPAYSNLFIETRFYNDKKCIVAKRKPKSDEDKHLWIANSVVHGDDVVSELEYETDRMAMLGRGRTVREPISVEKGKVLSKTTGPVLDPVVSMRTKVKVQPGQKSVITFVLVSAESNEFMLSLIDKYSTKESIETAFKLAYARSRVETNYLNIDAKDMELYQNMISDIIFLSPMRRRYEARIQKNILGQESLWKFGISGDNPIMLLYLKKDDRLNILHEALRAHEYWRLLDLNVDLVIITEEEYSYSLPFLNLVSDIVASTRYQDVNSIEDIFILESNKVEENELHLFYAVARIILHDDEKTMYKQVKEMQISNLPNKLTAIRQEEEYEVSQDEAFDLLYYNGLGGFTQEGDEYVIHLKEQQNTPAPWVNIISNPHFGFTVSESGSGYTWYKNSRENKITPWTNDAVSDAPGEVIYISEKETGQVWTSTPLPIREEESYTVRHGFGYSIFEHNSHGMKQRLIQFVPVDETVKISILNLKNISRKSRKLTLTYYVRPVLGVTDQTTALHVQTSATRAGTLMVENKYNVEFDDKICFVDTSINERTVTGDRHEFFGTGGMKDPEALFREHLSDTLGSGYDPCTAIQVDVMLEPNENKDIVFLLGMAKKMDVDSIANHYKSVKKSTDAFLEVKNFWKDKLTSVQVTTPIESMNLMLNGWLHYQVISSRLWGRTGFYQSGGAFGFRDQLQDVLSLAHFWPDITRSQILLHAKHQFIEGDVQHWWHEPSGKGTRTRFSDDRLWLPYVVSEYIRISGDESILNEQVSYLESPVLSEFEDERYGNPTKTQEEGSIYEHCIKAIEISCEFGRNGLPLMGSGDWNDGMNRVGNDGFGESVWLAWFLIVTLESFIPFCQEKGDSEKVQDYSQIMTQVTEAIEQNAWDGNWYRRAFFDDGTPLGSIKNEECKIDSLAQSWAVISGTGDSARAKIAMSSLEEHLVHREEGLIKLLTPPFDKGPQDPGYIKGYIPGVRENGGQYTHAASWVIIAFALLGEGDKSLELFELINPINHTDNLREYSRYKVEPYVIAADVYSVYPHVGRGGWTWYTGAAGWLYRAGLEYILGFKKNGTALVIDPCIPSTWKEYKMSYTYNQGTYEITINNPEGVNKGVKKISVDGKISACNRIELVDDQRTHVVEVFMG